MNRTHDLRKDDRADVALKKILGGLFGELRSKVAPVLEDTDTRALHDLRVANRRTRTAISEIGKVLPSRAARSFAENFKWLGAVTGPCRDLDVIHGAIDRHSGTDIDRAPLEPLRRYLVESREVERLKVASALRSPRFVHLVDRWEHFLVTDYPGGPRASAAIIDVAGECIRRAHRRVRKRGSGLTAGSPPDFFHRLRIDAKKLRYLLEFFADLYDGRKVARLVKELRQVQNVLGEFNDIETQLSRVAAFEALGIADRETLAATARLTDSITERQRELRTEFADRFSRFASDDHRKRFKTTVEAR